MKEGRKDYMKEGTKDYMKEERKEGRESEYRVPALSIATNLSRKHFREKRKKKRERK
jgi:hypothetical protein